MRLPTAAMRPQWAPSLNETNPTKRLPAYWQQDQPPPGGELPPDGTGSPAAGGSEIAALVVDRRRSGRAAGRRAGDRAGAGQRRDQDPDRRAAVARHARVEFGEPDPTPSTRTTPPSRPCCRCRRPARPARPSPTAPAQCKTSSTTSTATVARSASSTGIPATSYRPSSTSRCRGAKQVSLSQSAAHPASVTIVNIGHNVTCSVTRRRGSGAPARRGRHHHLRRRALGLFQRRGADGVGGTRTTSIASSPAISTSADSAQAGAHGAEARRRRRRTATAPRTRPPGPSSCTGRTPRLPCRPSPSAAAGPAPTTATVR